MTNQMKEQVIKINGYRVLAREDGMTKVYKGRKLLGVWWISVPLSRLYAIGIDLEYNAKVAIEAAEAGS